MANKFYIILKGELSVMIPNPKINDWDWALSVYKGLL